MPSRIATQRLDLVPSVIPARRPACDRSVHGDPPVMIVTRGVRDQSMRVTSPRFGTPGWWWAAMAHGPRWGEWWPVV
jgi:hypothetical protein